MKVFNRRTLPALALPLLALLFIAVLALGSVALRGFRLDLTEHRLYTLSDGTRRILDGLDEPVTLKLYYSEQASRDLPQFRLYAQRVRELLDELVARSSGKLSLQVIDPAPFSEAEDEAAAHGLQAVPLGQSGDSLYFGLVGSNSTDGEAAMPFIQPDKEAFLEYDVAKLISSLGQQDRPVLAILSSLPTGPGIDAGGNPNMGWVVDRQLGEFFEVRRLPSNPVDIAEDVDLLMLIHPKDLSEDSEYAIDQFVLRGGRLLVFVDPDAETESAGMGGLDALGDARSSDLPALFKAWGLRFDPGQVVLDSQQALQVQPDPNGLPVRHLAVLGLGKDRHNQGDVVSADLESINLSSAGAFSLVEGSPLKLEVLLQSSASAALTASERVRQLSDPSVLLADFQPTPDTSYVLAARLSGKLKTAFPARQGPHHLAESRQPANMIVVADTDLLSDRMWVQVQDFLGQPSYNAFANNGDFVYNAVDNLVGTGDLIAVRTRAASQRPFIEVEQLRRSAEQRYRAKADELQQQLQVLEQRLAQLQPASLDGKAQAMSAAQQAELARFQDDKLRIRKELRAVQRQLDAEIQALGGRLKLINILGMPLLLLLVGLVTAAWRWQRRRQGAMG